MEVIVPIRMGHVLQEILECGFKSGGPKVWNLLVKKKNIFTICYSKHFEVDFPGHPCDDLTD